MTEKEFTELLALKGFNPPVLVTREPDSGLALHAHPFEALALIVDGDITIASERGETTYLPGQTFHLLPDEPHVEHYGAGGVKYLAGRKG